MNSNNKDEMAKAKASSDVSEAADIRGSRRAQRAAERAARAQRKADEARERALEAARAGGLFEGMSAMPATSTPIADTRLAAPTASAGATTASVGRPRTEPGRPAGTGHVAPITAQEPGGGVADSSADRSRGRLLALLGVVSVVLLVLAGLASWGYIEARDDAAVEQSIASAPQEATDAAREITTQMFSYDHQTVDAELGAVREKLTDPALSEFVERSMPAVSSAAKQQEATVFATVAAAAAEEVVDEDHVTVLVMLNRMVSTKADPKAASSASRLRVDMVREGGQWKLGKLSSL